MRAAPPTLAAIVALGLWSKPARALPDYLTHVDFAPIQPSGLSVEFKPLFTVPPDFTSPPLARVQYVTALPDGRTFVNTLDGVISQAVAGGTATPYLNIATQNVGAVTNTGNPAGPGFSSVAFSPNFAGDPAQAGYGKFYTSTNIANPGTATPGTSVIGNAAIGSNQIEIREWTATDPHAATFSGTSRVVMDIAGYADSHSNGLISFNTAAKPGSADYGNLYIGSGDGLYNDGNQNAQNLGVPQGKLLRINPLQSGDLPYTIPAGNPFKATSGALPEIWAYGLRSPQSFSWDSVTGTMYINDLGQAALEEVDIGQAGANYGWSQREGTYATGYAYGQNAYNEFIYPVPPDSSNGLYTDPIAQYYHSEGYALGSGFVYRGTAIPALDGLYVMADIVTGRLFVFNPADAVNGALATVSELQVTQDGQLIDTRATYGYDSFLNGPRVDARLSECAGGELCVAMKSTGTVYELVPSEVPEPASLLLVMGGAGLAGLARRTRPVLNAQARLSDARA